MSASTEELLEQIMLLEADLQKAKLSYKPTDKFILNLETRLFELKEQLHSMNESLRNQKNILKG